MKFLDYFIIISIFLSCNQSGNNSNSNQKKSADTKIKSSKSIDISNGSDSTSIANLIIQLKNRILSEHNIQDILEVEDTLLDINFDGINDIILNIPLMHLGYEIQVFAFNKKRNTFKKNKQLSGNTNVVFDFQNKTFTSHYHGMGSGNGIKMKWKNNKWDTLLTYTVENNLEKSQWKINYFKPKSNKIIVKPYIQQFPKEF